jgi:hypothetical protein
MDSLHGIARLGGEKDGLALRFDYWQSPAAVTVAKNYHLTTLETGLYEAAAQPGMAVSLIRDELYPQQLLGRQFPIANSAAQFTARPIGAQLDAYRGYLKPLDFLRELERILEQSKPNTVSCTLVVGILAQGIEMSDVVGRYDRSSRLGELITADNQHCYIYQNTDSKSLALDNLQVILGLPVGAVFSEKKLVSDTNEIRLIMGELLQAAKRGDCPDFSSVHDVAPPLNASSSSRPRGAEHPMSHPRDVLPAASLLSGEEIDRGNGSESFLLLDFEPAKRSSTPNKKIFDRSASPNASGIYMKNNAELVEDIVFDADDDMYNTVFGKTEAPRAKRSQN